MNVVHVDCADIIIGGSAVGVAWQVASDRAQTASVIKNAHQGMGRTEQKSFLSRAECSGVTVHSRSAGPAHWLTNAKKILSVYDQQERYSVTHSLEIDGADPEELPDVMLEWLSLQ